MSANLINLWTVDYQKVAHRIQELEIAGAKRLDDLVRVLSSDIRVSGPDASVQSLSESRVDQLLGHAATPRQLLSEIDSLDAAAQRWRSTLEALREAVKAQASPDVLTSPPALCEADDEYWYL